MKVEKKRYFGDAVYQWRDRLRKETPAKQYARNVDSLKDHLAAEMKAGRSLAEATNAWVGGRIDEGKRDGIEWMWAAAADLSEVQTVSRPGK